MHSAYLLPLLAGLAASQSTTTDIPADVVPTPDALDVDFLRDIPAPTYTTIEGVLSQDVPYATQTAIQSAAAEVSETPLSVFPAITTVPINAAGESDATATDTPSKRQAVAAAAAIQRRAACDSQATISNYYNVDVSSYASFKADTKIAQVANDAATPSGYTNSFKNKQAANSAYAYLGYKVLQTGYDVANCAQECTDKEGCLAFNIYFERDPTIEPGDGCTNPTAFANIKCSFWGSALDETTATNDGQWRSEFQVGIAGSNAYTSEKVGPSIAGWNDPLRLNNAAMNAPLRDCAGTWTYMGYKFFNDGPFSVDACAAACDAQTEYNIAHPPSSGYVPLCAAFGTYLLTKTTSSGSVIQGQMCTMYTSAWDAQYAVNTASYDDSIGAKYTYSYSYFYSKPDVQPVCDVDISYLKSAGAEFCSSYISYTPSTSVEVSTTVPGVSTVYQTTGATTTTTVYTRTATVTASAGNLKRDDDSAYTGSDYSIDVSTSTVSIPNKAALGNSTATPSDVQIAKRAVQTPTSIVNWPAAKISAACSNVATGVVLTTSISTAPVPLTTAVVTRTTTETVSTVSTLTIPAVLLSSPTTIVSGATTSSDDNYYRLELPFSISIYGISSSVVYLTDNSVLYWPSSDAAYNYGWEYTNQPLPYSTNSFGNAALFGLWDDLYVYRGTNQGIYYDVTGAVGDRTVVFEFYTSAYSRSTEFYHFTITMTESNPGVAVYRYYDVYQSGYSATVGAQKRGGSAVQYSYNQAIITAGLMLTVDTNRNTITRGSFTP
ncbi:carbohydrate-binding-like protein [Diplodia corticola]|uniref:Carbohydrate-binding-like protein n=1 Tax=Diplodia corticola TaxID=236234 RepID=A0A1J9S270_9PEZI|nr:carbohydrate-binding-like protein [Diplodia corticola]OJD39059.1 carbohydrate-binding-like protein [Diplodia corticola]